MRYMNVSVARLLDTVSYAMRKPCKAKNLMGEEITVIDTFPYNPGSKTSPETAKRWAEGYAWNNKNNDPAEYLTRDNEPFAVTITDLDVRSEGGRAYKVIDADNRRFDLREDQVIEVMRLVGVQPSGKIPAQFVWGLLGSQLRLILVDGELHKVMAKQTEQLKDVERRKSTGGNVLTPAKLLPGHVYSRRDGKRVAFIGRVRVPEINKLSYAFVDDMPSDEVPMRWNREQSDGQGQYLPITDGWAQMSFNERLEFLRANDPCHGIYTGIKLMQSPKVEDWTDIGVIDVGYYKGNKESKCYYSDGYGSDIVEYRWVQKHGHRPHSDPSFNMNWRLSVGDREKRCEDFRKQQERLALQARSEFRDQLVWL